MKVLSMIQPWATLVVMGAKKYETRSWSTTFRGGILIHASRKKDTDFSGLCEIQPFKKYINGHHGYERLPFGQIIGEVKIKDMFQTETIRYNLSEQELAFGDYDTGRYAWEMVQPIQFKIPIPCRGSLSLWDCPDDIMRQIIHYNSKPV